VRRRVAQINHRAEQLDPQRQIWRAAGRRGFHADRRPIEGARG
jgi:hypothetical protein